MKLGVSYNLFDGEELLEKSIKLIRDNVDYVSVVFQQISNYGNKCDIRAFDILNDLKKDQLIDKIIEFTPELRNGVHFNEISKRNLGLISSQSIGCTHHMSMDVDEFYIPKEFAEMKKIIEDNDYDSSYCQMLTYYKNDEYILDPPEDYYVSLIYKIRPNVNYVFNYPSPVHTDPTRRMLSGNFKIFNRDELQMHHMSMVRDDISVKLVNSSAKVLFKDNIGVIVNDYNKWEYPNEVTWPGNPLKKLKVKKIKSYFNE